MECDTISNIVQSKYWKECTSGINGIILPIVIYQDDFETGNPLGSHASIHKLSGIYASLPCLPPQFISKLDNIFLLQLNYSDDASYFGNNSVYKRVVQELNYLRAVGITINIDGNPIIIKFQLAMIIGDNLGLNTILGFVQSFQANYYCRFCTSRNERSQISIREDPTLLRMPASYEKDVSKKDVSVTGLKEKSIWNLVDGFHVYTNYCVDAMHDLLEGVCKYDMSFLLHYYIIEKNYLL